MSVHYPLLWTFLSYIYVARKHHRSVANIDVALATANFNSLKLLCGVSSNKGIFHDDLDVHDDKASPTDNCVPGLPGLEPRLQVTHADLITKLEKLVSDDPAFACCSCERLFQRKNVTSMKQCDKKFTSNLWEQVKGNILAEHGNVDLESFYVCSYCRPMPKCLAVVS